MHSRKSKIISTHVTGVQSLLRGNKVEVIAGKAKLAPSMQIEIDSKEGQKQVIQAKRIILATGSKPTRLPIPGADIDSGVINAEKILDLDYLPESLIMIGGGVIGVELVTILAKLGCRVSLVEMMPHILPAEDAELVSIVARALEDDGVQIYAGARVDRIEETKGVKSVTISTDETEKKLEAEMVVIAVGYSPNVEGLGLEEVGVVVNKGGIQVKEHMETSVPNIYAAGDAIGGIMLAYVAIKVGRFPFSANSMATIMGERRGLVKIITDQKYGQILGVHIIGPRATDLIPEAALAIKLDATPQEIITTMHPHPSLSEAIWEAARDVSGETIHFPSQNK
jgi:dihydrolipoamide dehydrogenase